MMKFHRHFSSIRMFVIGLMLSFTCTFVSANDESINQDIEQSILSHYQNFLIKSFVYYRDKFGFQTIETSSITRNFPVLIENGIVGISQEKFKTELFFSDLYATKIKTIAKVKQKIIRISNIPVSKGFLSSRFGLRKDPIHGLRRMHKGIDIAAKYGSTVKPLGEGLVVFAGYKSGYGNTVEIKHGNTVLTRYAHLKQFMVDKGQQVKVDDKIGLIGRSGRSTGPHLHLEVLLNGNQVDPQIFLANHFGSRSNSYQLARAKPAPKVVKKKLINKVAINLPRKVYPKVSAFPQVSYQDYVNSVDGLFGFSAPTSFAR